MSKWLMAAGLALASACQIANAQVDAQNREVATGRSSAPEVSSQPVVLRGLGPAKSSAGKKPTMLYGRIEEIVSHPGARLPSGLKATGGLDGNSVLKGNASSQRISPRTSYPTDWRGLWSGTLKIHSAQFDPVRWKLDAVEATQEKNLMRPGTSGEAAFEFQQNKSGISLMPSRVVFTTTMEVSRYHEIFQRLWGNDASSVTSDLKQQLDRLPYIYMLHLGDLEDGIGVTGNVLRSRVLKNEVKPLAEGVIEQSVVTYNAVQSPSTNKIRYSYGENVVRFTRLSANQLYVQAVLVNYLADRSFEYKVSLYGTIERGRAPRWPAIFNNALLN